MVVTEAHVLLTGIGGSAATNFADSLKHAPPERYYRITGTDSSKSHLPLSRAEKNYLIPKAMTNPEAYVENINRIIRAREIHVVHPQPDPEVLVLASFNDRLEARTFLPSAETVVLCQNKLLCNHHLAKHRVPVPAALQTSTRDHTRALTDHILEKYGRAWVRATYGAGSKAALPVSTTDQAEFWIAYWHKERGIAVYDFMISEFLPGKEFAWQSLWKDGKLLVSQARERVSYLFGHLTPSGQTSSPSVARTVSRADVNATSTIAVLAVDPKANGIFCVDLKEDAAGTPKVTEINAGRFFTTSNFFSRAGLNMPDLYLRLALGEDIPPQKVYNPLPPNLWWVRMMDMGHTLVKHDEFCQYVTKLDPSEESTDAILR